MISSNRTEYSQVNIHKSTGVNRKKKKRCLTLVSLRGHQDAANIAYLLATRLWVLLGCFGWRPTRRLARSMKCTFCYMCNKTSLKNMEGKFLWICANMEFWIWCQRRDSHSYRTGMLRFQHLYVKVNWSIRITDKIFSLSQSIHS